MTQTQIYFFWLGVGLLVIVLMSTFMGLNVAIALLPAAAAGVLALVLARRPAIRLRERRILAVGSTLFVGLVIAGTGLAVGLEHYRPALVLLLFAGAGAWVTVEATRHYRHQHRGGTFGGYFRN